MERSAAIKKLGKLLGKSLGYRVDLKAPTSDERAAAQAMLPALTEEKRKAEEAVRLRRTAILAGDCEYQELVAAHKKMQEEWSRVAGMTRQHKFTVGTTNGMFFMVKAEGDSWEEVISKVEKR
jgi:hypothetical protein